jgi:hypothetical protein
MEGGTEQRAAISIALNTSGESRNVSTTATRPNIGFVRRDGQGQSRDRQTHAIIAAWSTAQGINAVVWTDLQSNFPEKTGKRFSPDAAMEYLERLPEAGRRAASEYINNAPAFVDTPLRRKVA